MTKHWFAAQTATLFPSSETDNFRRVQDQIQNQNIVLAVPVMQNVSPSTEDDDNSLSLMADSQQKTDKGKPDKTK
jgi:hypothetical protein